MKKQSINEVRRWQKLAGILNESKTLAEVPEDELGTIFDKPKQWVGKELTIIDGEFAKKYPAYKNTKATFISYNNQSELVIVTLKDGKQAGLYRNELQFEN